MKIPRKLTKEIKIFLMVSLGILLIGSVIRILINSNNKIQQRNEHAVYYPQESDRVIVNPYMGLAPLASARNVYQPFSLVYSGVSWSELEPEKGKYNFEEFEKKYKYEYWKQKGVKFIIRFYMDVPSQEKHMDIPDWLYSEINKSGTWYDKDGKKGFSPNYKNEILIENHRRLIKAFGERYNNDSTVAFIELGSIGHWGEWHVTYIDKQKKVFPEVNISDRYVEHYIEHFSDKTLLMRRPFKIAKDRNMGLFNDSFGNIKQTEDYFLKWIKEGYKDHYTDEYHPSMLDFWKTSPSGGEFSNYPGELWIEKENIDKTLSMLKESNTSWLGPSSPSYIELTLEKQKNMDKILNTMGYRFRVKESNHISEVKQGENIKGTIEISNDGIAPFYYNWPMYIGIYDLSDQEVSRTQLNYDIRKILPGVVRIQYNISVKDVKTTGSYKMKIFILDPETETPAIEFANVNEYEDKTLYIGSFKVIN